MRSVHIFLTIVMVSSCFLFGPPKRGKKGKNKHPSPVGVGCLMTASALKDADGPRFTAEELCVGSAVDIPLPLIDTKAKNYRESCSFAACSVGILLECMAQGAVVECAVKKNGLPGWVGAVCDKVATQSARCVDERSLHRLRMLLAEKGSDDVATITASVASLHDVLLGLKPHESEFLVRALKTTLQAFRADVATPALTSSAVVAGDEGAAGAGDGRGADSSGDGDAPAPCALVVDVEELIGELVEGFSLCVNGLTREMLATKRLSEEGLKHARLVYDWVDFFKAKIKPYEAIVPVGDVLRSGGVYYSALDGVKSTLQRTLAFARYCDSSTVDMKIHESFKVFLHDALLFLFLIDKASFEAVMNALFLGDVPEFAEELDDVVLPRRDSRAPATPSRRDKKLRARSARKARQDADFFAWLDACGSRELYESLLKK